MEGYCDSLAYEIAPFNVKLSILQASIEVSVLTNQIIATPPLAAYSEDENPAPLSRRMISSLLNHLNEANGTRDENDEHQSDSSERPGDVLMQPPQVTSIVPSAPPEFQRSLIAETVYAILSIGGHDNPPARHIVGHEGVASVKEKLKTVSEELEEFVEISAGVDL